MISKSKNTDSNYLYRLKLEGQIECKNRRGKFSKGRKVNTIQFISEIEVMVTTADSRVRVLDIQVFYLLSLNDNH